MQKIIVTTAQYKNFPKEKILKLGNVARYVNKQIFKVEFKNIFLFYLTVLFCCDVGVSDLVLKPICPSTWGLYKKCNFISENEAFYQN